MKLKNRICFVASSGGHLAQIISLHDWWRSYDRIWVTFNKVDAASTLKGERVFWAHHPTNRNIPNLVRNFVLALRILLRERPKIIFSTGAGVALPFYWIGKLMGCKLVYLEVYDRLDAATMTGRLLYPLVDEFLVQWDEQLRFYPNGKLWGQAL